MKPSITFETIEKLMAWTKTASMFLSSPEGVEFAEELREVFSLAAEKLEDRKQEL